MEEEEKTLMPKRWVVYIDESGDFDKASDCCLVSGVLYELGEGETPFSLNLELETSLEANFPELSWPPHASQMNTDACWLLWRYAYERAAMPEAFKEILEALLKHLTQEEYQGLVNSLVHEKDFKDGVRKKLYWLKRNRLTSTQRARLEEYASKKRWAFSQWMRSAPNSAFAILSSDRHAPPGSLTSNAPHDRYNTHLIALFERLRDAVLAIDGEHDIEVHIANRNVSGLGERRDTVHKLDHAHCHTCWHEEMARAARWQSEERITRVTFTSYRYGKSNTPAVLVQADYLANRLRESLRNSNNLKGLTDTCARSGFALHLDGQYLYLASQLGAARTYLDGLREHATLTTTPTLPPNLVDWSRRQTHQWANYFHNARRIALQHREGENP